MINFNILNRWTGNVQFTAEINCPEDAPYRVKLGLAVRWGVKNGAVLRDADLSGADLRDADLRGAVLSGDKLVKWIAEARRGDGYSFIALLTERNGVKIKAGCRWFTEAEFRAHVAANYLGTDKATETLAILDYLAVRARQVSPAVQTPSIAA